jgi:hypothetical protein
MFSKNRSRGDGLQNECKVCFAIRSAKYRAANPEKVRIRNAKYHAANPEKIRIRHTKYRMSLSGIASSLRNTHGLNGESVEWARILLNEESRCLICGIPGYKVHRLGFWKYGSACMNRHLTLDHITPGVNDGRYRPLCYSCNLLRGAAVLTDAEVLTQMRGWYRALFTIRKLWWLNTHVDENGVCVGGRLYRNETMRKKFEGLKPEGEWTKQDVESAAPHEETIDQLKATGIE